MQPPSQIVFYVLPLFCITVTRQCAKPNLAGISGMTAATSGADVHSAIQILISEAHIQ